MQNLETTSQAEQTLPLLRIKTVPFEQLQDFAERRELFAIIDACDAPEVPPKMQELSDDRAVSLFKGTAQEAYWAVAPYLAQVDLTLLRWLKMTLWRNPWGVLIVTTASLQTLSTHFRKFLIVTLPDDKNWFLRFYDPRVLPDFLRSCTRQEISDFYGPSRGFVLTPSDRRATCCLIAPSD